MRPSNLCCSRFTRTRILQRLSVAASSPVFWRRSDRCYLRWRPSSPSGLMDNPRPLASRPSMVRARRSSVGSRRTSHCGVGNGVDTARGGYARTLQPSSICEHIACCCPHLLTAHMSSLPTSRELRWCLFQTICDSSANSPFMVMTDESAAGTFGRCSRSYVPACIPGGRLN